MESVSTHYRPDVAGLEAEHFGGLHGHRGAGAADVHRSAQQADRAVAV